MTFRLMTILTALAFATSLASSADAKHRYRHKRAHAPAPATDLWYAPAPQEPARMIQVRPGVWISSYGCVTDEGYGRISPCDVGDGKR